MAEPHPLEAWFRRVARLPGGKRAFSRAVCLRAPYFASISPVIQTVEPGHVVVFLRKRRAVQNHIGTVHAIAMCNACELAGGLATEVGIPSGLRWIPKGMTVEYLAKATTDLTATACIDSAAIPDRGGELAVPVVVTDTDGQIVMQADITMWLSEKRPK
ncbi:MAG: DUF4442 domain-containing protein [Salinisphaeraceae bacterium]|nr:DUF4442 domain-containing protein [Salinisphaeraceae bacterium]